MPHDNASTLMLTNQAGALRPANLAEAMQFAEMLAKSDLVPKDYKGKPGNCMVAMQMGAEIGLAPMQAIQNIAVINGRPAVWGDALLALVQAHPDCEDVIETDDGATATCTIKRRGRTPVTRTFSTEDAKAARLAGKEGPWTNYPKRMRQMRARGFACRDAFADVLRGLASAEEAQDIPPEPKASSSRKATVAKLAENTPIVRLPSQPPPGHAAQAVDEAPRFKGKDPEWAGRLVSTAPAGVIASYVTTLEEFVAGLRAKNKSTGDVPAHLAAVQEVYERALEAEMHAAEERARKTAGDQVADRLQATIDARTGDDGDANADWSMGPA